MDAASKSSVQMFGAYCGPLYIVVLLVGFWLIAGFVPPTPPSTSTQGIAALYQDPTHIRIGMIFVMRSALVFIPFAATVSHFLARIEGGAGVLAFTALLGGAGNMALTFYPPIWWLAAAYRPERSAELIRLFNDVAWLQLIGGVSMYDALPLSVTIAAFCDKSPNPVFPRWAGYGSIMIMMLLMPDQLLFFFHSGPFAWNGVFGFWIPLCFFSLFFLVCFWLMRTAILRERRSG